MIPTLYPTFRKWSETGSVYLISDTHFVDEDCALMDKNWIDPQSHIDYITSKIHKSDTLIHLGDVGDQTWLQNAWKPHKRPHMVLIMGNHDEAASRFADVFDEIYTGPLFIAEKILLSHEPIYGLDWCMNIHGHDHAPSAPIGIFGKCPHIGDKHHINLASNVVDYQVVNLADIIKSGIINRSTGLHRATIDRASKNPIKKKNR